MRRYDEHFESLLRVFPARSKATPAQNESLTPQPPMAVTQTVISIVMFTFIGYLNIGIPLAVLPGYVHSDLGFGAVIAGLVISVQYLATVI
ncbi:major facilitator superfamily transporter, partial [Pseudomonas syringae pv. actinidiae ICMP 18804]